MFASIRLKLFSLIVLGNILMVGLLMAMNAASFSRSFSDYIVQQESRRLQPLIQNLASEYDARGHWGWVRWDNSDWQALVQASFSSRDFRMMERPRKRDDSDRSLVLFLERLSLREAGSDQRLLGPKTQNSQLVWLPIESVTTGQPIAYLGFQPSARLDSQFDNLFARQQQRQLMVIGLAGVLLAALLAIPFSGWLVRPIQRLSGAVRDMTQGDLSVSVPEDRKDELGRLAVDFNQLASALQKNQQDRQQWVSDIAHELRTPVAIFQADIEAAQDGVREVNDAWLASMHAQVQRLTALVNDLHQLSQSDAGTLNYRFERLDLGALVDEFVSRSQWVCQEQSLSVEWQKPAFECWVEGDASRLTQLFNNLLQNSLRYTDGPGTLRIQLTYQNGQLNLTWEDSSPGVDDTDLPRLFDRLYRVDASRSRDSGGAGLGLAIVSNIATAHQGDISARHSALGGLCIELKLKGEAKP